MRPQSSIAIGTTRTPRELSQAADIRVAWGGREAVEAIVNLPRRYGTEDIVFGPKLSCDHRRRAAGRCGNRPADGRFNRRRRLGVRPAGLQFAAYGFRRARRSDRAAAEFARLLGEAMEIESHRAPLAEIDPAAAMNVLAVRTEYAMRGEVFHSRDIQWAVVYSDEDSGSAEPCYLRTVFVRAVNDVFDVVEHCSAQTQTVGLAVDGRGESLADALTVRGVERCPAVGAMRTTTRPGMVSSRWTAWCDG